MSLVRFALLALLGAHGGVAGLVRPKQPVVPRIHTETNHASFPTGKISSEGPREVSKKTATKQAPNPRAPTISKQDKLEAHGGVAGMKHSRTPVAHSKVAEAPTVKLFAGKTSSKDPLDDDAHKLGETYARAFGKTATKHAPSPRAPTISKQDKLEAHGGVAGMKHSKPSVAHQKVAEAPTVKLFAGKTSSKDPLDDDAHKLGEAYARAFGKTATEQAPSPHAPTTPQGTSAKPSPVRMQDRLSDNAEHMIEAAMDFESVDGV